MPETITENAWEKAGMTSDSISNKSLLNYHNHLDKVPEIVDNPSLFEKGVETEYQNEREGFVTGLLEYPYFMSKIKFNVEYNFKSLDYLKFKGFVTAINEEYFEARIYEIGKEGTYEIAEFEIKDIDPNDLDLFQVGAAFYWTLGRFYIKGQLIKKSELRFQRLANITTQEHDSTVDEANHLNASINWD